MESDSSARVGMNSGYLGSNQLSQVEAAHIVPVNGDHSPHSHSIHGRGAFESSVTLYEDMTTIRAESSGSLKFFVDEALKNPSKINQNDATGNTLFHRVCREGKDDYAETLISNGAVPLNINSTNNKLEAPLHLACQSGNIHLVALLLKNNSDVHAKDENGKSVMHLAHTNVYILYYLSEYYHVEVDLIDNMLKTPLHYACERGIDDVITFLVKKKCSLEQSDLNGDTPLHILAGTGNRSMCWEILRAGGVGLLHLCNKQGKTPLDIAKDSTEHGCREMIPDLQTLYDHPDRTFRPEVDLKTRLWYTVKPEVWYLGGLLLGNIFLPLMQGYIVFPAALTMLYKVYADDHRIGHISRMQNPVKAGALGLGMLFSVICFCTTILPVILADGLVLPGFAAIGTPILIYVYVKAWQSDPGYVKYSMPMTNSTSLFTLKDLVDLKQRPQAMCRCCLIIPKMPTKHCKLCERCVFTFDHHCQYIMKCIGYSNRRLFLLLISVLLISMLIFLYSCVQYFNALYPNLSYTKQATEAFYHHSGILTLVMFNGLFALMMMFLLRAQLVFISKGYTYYFHPTNPGHVCPLTLSERLSNIIQYMIGSDELINDPLYNVL